MGRCAVAAHQLEGGFSMRMVKVSKVDVLARRSWCTTTSNHQWRDRDGENYPNQVAVISYHRYKEDIKLFAEMAS
ncbi:family 1 glycosylhydrolase [Vibrio chagasii]|nr:family 1 glycosylhydrolase [Vibrio chagasii]